jgi:hypothetical protein
MKEIELHILPAEEGGWQVRRVRDGGFKVVGQFVRKRDAEIATREHLIRQGGGTEVIYRVNGEIEERNEVPTRVAA